MRRQSRSPVLSPQEPFARGNPVYRYVTLQIRGDGPSGSPVKDSSRYARPISSSGTVSVSNAVVKNGSGSILFGGGFLSTPYAPSLNMQGVDCTVDGWGRLTTSTGSCTMVDFRGNSSTFDSSWEIFTDPVNRRLGVYDGPTDTVVAITSANALPAANGAWWRWKVTSLKGLTALYVDNVKLIEVSYAPPATHSSGVRIGINYNGVNAFAGNLDDIRLTRGVAITWKD